VKEVAQTPEGRVLLRKFAIFALAGLAVILPRGAAALADEPAIRFDRDIRPILAENCYACHGPGNQEAGLRLDSHEAATAELASGSRAIRAGDVGASEMLARIAASDPDVVMPPPHSKKEITPEQRDLLTRWIAAGAAYEQHWSFRPVVRPEVPAAADPAVTNPIDRFLEARLAEARLPVNPEADRPTLLRRLSFALTGLPPTPAEVEAFVADTAADAYEKQVARLLNSPHHGEEMARHWLDVARYADTHGLHLDNERQMWAYRDWVVKAFNDNLPFDQFTIWQLAGDLLPDATLEQKVATGFSRCNVTTSEGGSINDELLFRYAVDRTATTTNAFMGLTGQCAVCHDHKFDPISQREFYSLYAFFNSAADPGFDGNILRTAPTISLPTPAQASELEHYDRAVAEAEARVLAAVNAAGYADPAEASTKPAPVRIETVWLDDDFPAGADVRSGPGGPLAWIESDVPGVVFSGHRSLERTAVGIGQDFCQDLTPALEIPAKASIFVHAWIDPENPPRAIMLQLQSSGWKHRAVWGDWTVLQLDDQRLDRPGLTAGDLPEAGRWVRLAVEPERLGLAAAAQVTGLALTQFDGHVRWDRLGVAVDEDPATSPTRSLAAWWRARAEHRGADVPADLAAIVARGPEQTTDPGERERVRRHWIARVWAERPAALAAAVRDLDAARKIRVDFVNSFVQTFVFNDLPQMRDSFIMQRGNYDQPGDKVERGTPAFLPALAVAEGKSPDRLDLAKWLVSADQPLTPRVAANRLWQQFFGVGLVKTSEDFGLQGEPPAHPGLLDWLAAEYREGGWNTRQMVKLLVTSRAFRRASDARPEQLTADPENRLLARGPRFRLDAEQIRDNALAVSGLLVRSLGGVGVKPYQPPNIWEPVGFGNSNTRHYKQDSGDALYRRTMYLFVKRTAPHPALVNFDAPNREQFCGRRERSNTPLQALQLMNDIQHVEAARALAARTLAEAPADDAARIEWLYKTVLARPPSAAEAKIVAGALAGNRARYESDLEAAKQAIAHGESKPPAGLAPAELASWTLLANLMLNLDETLSRN
jgi:mono/diheme cytochrome c family protein